MQPSSSPAERLVGARGLSAVASRFERASHAMLRARALLRRKDTKFLLPSHRAVWVLASVIRDYRVLPSDDGVLLARYRTVYFDTPGLWCFEAHRRGRRPRHKVRIRHYLDLGRTFFEIKTKGPDEETTKYRHELPFGDETLDERERRVVTQRTRLPGGELEPSMVIEFRRMTLLGDCTDERMTIDVDLAFQERGPLRTMNSVSILEIKQRRLYRRSPIMRALRAHGFRPRSSSKYCTGMALARPCLRDHHVRPVLRAMERMQT